ncbi:MAG TPA: HPr kinase/phosphorylase, partial [Usitatibacteraceae bacterium]|nr:HPr kinase/phosphorylase [Usitatibacteraceae bacterium]
MPRLSVQQLFEDRRERLGLAWAAGASGSQREITHEMLSRPGLGLIGHLNLIHPLVVQVLGARELDYLKGLDAAAAEAT